MNDSLNVPVQQSTGSSSLGAFTALPPKTNLTVRQIQNGYVIHVDKNGYAYNEKSYIAKDKVDLTEVLTDIINEDF